MCAIIVVLQLMFPSDSLNNMVNLLSLCKKLKHKDYLKKRPPFFAEFYTTSCAFTLMHAWHMQIRNMLLLLTTLIMCLNVHIQRYQYFICLCIYNMVSHFVASEIFNQLTDNQFSQVQRELMSAIFLAEQIQYLDSYIL